MDESLEKQPESTGIIKRLGTRNIILIVVVGSLTIGLIMALGFIIADFGEPVPRPQFQFEQAVVAADSVECSIIGRDILQAGGSAADAGIASLICLNLFSAHSTGIGGGNFLLYYDRANMDYTFYNGRETAPEAATDDMFDEFPGNSTKGGLAVAVPGEISAMWSLHQAHGLLPWSKLFTASIKWAREGFVVPLALGNAIRQREADIWADNNLKEIFVKTDCPNEENEEGKEVEVDECLVEDGEILRMPKLADTLQKIADGGRHTFYIGDLADDIVADLAEYDSIITKLDMSTYTTSVKDDPIQFKLGSWTATSVNPPGSGAVLALILNILEGYNFNSDSISNTEKSVLTYHRIIEAFKFAYAKRSALGDVDSAEMEEIVRDMTDQAYADDIRLNKINDSTTHEYTYYEPAFGNVDDQGTTHVSVIDSNGNACSATGTINTYFGAKLRGSRTGILFNNEMDDFSTNATNYFGLPPSPANFIEEGKRPMSSMTPTILVDTDGNVQQVVGASGGTRITTSVATTIINTRWLGMSLIDAIESPRLHDQLIPEEVTYEEGFNKKIVDGLRDEKGHNMKNTTSFAVVQGVRRLADEWYDSHCDYRKGGRPSGY